MAGRVRPSSSLAAIAASSAPAGGGKFWTAGQWWLSETAMAKGKLDVQKKQHRERGQTLKRQKLGILEKHKDYVKRARDYHSKQDRLRRLQEKAASRNKDELYFGMIRSQTRKGVHVQQAENKALPTDLVKLLKTQDAGYIRTQRLIEEKVRSSFPCPAKCSEVGTARRTHD